MFGAPLIIIITYMKADILKPSRQTILREAKDYVMIAVGMILYGIGWTVFLLPNDITTGGVPGIASIVYWATGFPVQYTYFSINFFLLLLALKLLGLKFCIKTIFGVFTLTFFLSVIQQLASGVSLLRDQPFMACVIGASFCGGGIGVAFCANGSTGGTDIIAMILKRYSSFDIGKALLMTDIMITVAGCFVFDIKTGLYSFLGLTIRSFMIDNFIEGFNLSKYFNVVCDEPEPICNYLVHELNRSATVVRAQGAFSGKDKYIVFTVLSRPQAVRLRNFIKENQPSAFMLISNTSEIIGKGFHSI